MCSASAVPDPIFDKVVSVSFTIEGQANCPFYNTIRPAATYAPVIYVSETSPALKVSSAANGPAEYFTLGSTNALIVSQCAITGCKVT